MGFWKHDAGMQKEIRTGNHYSRLSLAQQEAYRAVAGGLAAFQKKIQVNGVSSKEEMERVVCAVIWEQPQLFYFNSSVIDVMQSGSHSVFLPEYIYDKKKAAQVSQQIEESASFLLSQMIADGMDHYQECMAIHDYMTENISYNFSALSVAYAYDAFNLEGVLVKRQAVCEGIAKGVSYLLGRLGIPNTIVCGKSDINGRQMGHAWNMVELGGSHYHLDVTWDLQEINHFTNHSHMYFNLDDESMLTDHEWELEDYPSCSSRKENYYVKEKRYFRTIRGFELYAREFLAGGQGFMDVRFEDTLGFPEDPGGYLAGLIQKNARYLGREVQVSFVFNPYNYVFQADVSY
ncbi:MAG: hypothetical protein HFH38_07120 [Lachnospiraceae bacterium]|nr:hypothetical protein [Lachnospiraceae bacterium]